MLMWSVTCHMNDNFTQLKYYIADNQFKTKAIW
jgi:hypothetical protein